MPDVKGKRMISSTQLISRYVADGLNIQTHMGHNSHNRQLSALVAKMGLQTRKRDNALKRGDVKQAAKYEKAIDKIHVRLTYLADVR